MTRHLCTGCHGGWRSARCRPRHGASSIGLEDTPWRGWRTKTVWAAPRWRSALKVAPRRRTCTLTAPRWCHVTELAPRRHRAGWAAPRWRSVLRIAPRWRTCMLAAPRWHSATELAPWRHRAVRAVPRRRRAANSAPRRPTCVLAAPRWCAVTEVAPRWHWTVWAAPQRRSAEKSAPRRCSAQEAAPRRRTGTFAAPRWCPATETAPRRCRAVGAGATLASGGRGEATYVHLSPTGLHVWPREGSWTVGGRGGPGLTQGRRTRNRDVSRLASSVAVRVGNPSHSYHPEGFWTGARSPVTG